MPINIRYTHRLLTSRIGNIGRALGVGVCHRYPDQGGTPKLAGPEQYHAGTVSDTADTSSPSYLGVPWKRAAPCRIHHGTGMLAGDTLDQGWSAHGGRRPCIVASTLCAQARSLACHVVDIPLCGAKG